MTYQFSSRKRRPEKTLPVSLAEPESTAREGHWNHAAKRDLLEQISNFLLHHDLPLDARNLSFAHTIFSGDDLSLTRKVVDREEAGEAICQHWLEQVAQEHAKTKRDDPSLERVIDQIERAVVSFADTTAAAQSENDEAQDAMQKHVDEANIGGISAEQVLKLSGAVLTTLNRIEKSMQRSQDETLHLRAQLDKARIEANCDHLTGLPNRRAFEQTLEQFHRQAVANSEPLFVAICDVDKFKRINDTFGHEAGDRMLRAIAGVLQRYASPDCFVARHGGEEFIMLIRKQTAQEAFDCLDLARRELAARKFVARRNKQAIGKVTFSAGIADVFASENPREALAAADAALYRAKNEGRNRIIQAG